MARSLLLSLTLTVLFIGMVSARDWNILNQLKGTTNTRNTSKEPMNLNGTCESWRINVELNNIRDFLVVPKECVWYVQKYMTSYPYEDDVKRAVDEAILYLEKTCFEKKKCDWMDAWIFDIDDTLLSTIPYHKNNGCFGGEQLNTTKLEECQKRGKAPAVPNVMKLYDEIKERGLKIFLVSSRKEYLRSATVDNLLEAGYREWSNIILRGEADEKKSVSEYNADFRKWVTSLGFRVWGVMGAQWNSFAGCPVPKRTFKLPNSIYYVA